MLRTQKANPLACTDKHRNACQSATDKRKTTQYPADKAIACSTGTNGHCVCTLPAFSCYPPSRPKGISGKHKRADSQVTASPSRQAELT